MMIKGSIQEEDITIVNIYTHNIRCTSIHKANSYLTWWVRPQRICFQCRGPRFSPWVGNIHWRRSWQPTPLFLPGKSQWQRRLVVYRPWGSRELVTTERLTLLHFATAIKGKLDSNTVIGGKTSIYMISSENQISEKEIRSQKNQ